MDIASFSKIADFGIGMVIAVGFVYIVIVFAQKYTAEKPNTNTKKDDYFMQLIKNNTDAINNLTEVIHTMQLTLIQVNTKNDEILDKLRRMGKS